MTTCRFPHRKLLTASVAFLVLLSLLILWFPVTATHWCGNEEDSCYCGRPNFCWCCDNNYNGNCTGCCSPYYTLISEGPDGCDGNCVWWVWEMACCNWGIPFYRCKDADEWDDDATEADYVVLDEPSHGTIGVKEEGKHVVWVQSVAANGTSMQVSEMRAMCDGVNCSNPDDCSNSVRSNYSGYSVCDFIYIYPPLLRTTGWFTGPTGKSYETGAVFLVQNHTFYHIAPDSLDSLEKMVGLPRWSHTENIEASVISQVFNDRFEKGPDFVPLHCASDGLLIREYGEDAVYLMDGGKKRWITTLQVFEGRGYDWKDVIDVSSALFDSIPRGLDITSGTQNAELELYFTPNSGSFEIEDSQLKSVSVVAGQHEGKEVNSFVRVTYPDGEGGTNIRYAYYPSADFEPSDPLQFSMAKRSLYPGSWTLTDSNWTWDEYVFNGSESVGTWTWEFWYEDATTGQELTGMHAEASYEVPAKLAIVDQHLSCHEASAGQEITFHYTISNPSSSFIKAGEIRLGAQIRKTDSGGDWIDYYAGDRYPQILTGTSSIYSRPFVIPPNDNYGSTPDPGTYDARWILVDNKTGQWLDSASVGGVLNVSVENPPPEVSTGKVSGTVEHAGSGLAGVTMSLVGPVSRSTTTDQEGNYVFSDVPAGTFTTTPSKMGFTFEPAYRIVEMIVGGDSSPMSAAGVAFRAQQTTNCQPLAPSNLKATPDSSRAVDLTWEPVDNAQEYVIYTSKEGGSYSPIDVVEQGTSSYRNVGLDPNSQYCYKLKSQTNCGASGYSNESCASTLPDSTSDPYILLSQSILSITAIEGNAGAPSRSVSLTNGGGGSLNWSAVSNAAWLEVSPATGTAPSEFLIDLDLAGLGTGIYEGRVEITCPTALNTPVELTVELEVFPEAYYSLSWTDHGSMPEAGEGMASAVLFNEFFLIGVGGFRTCHSYDPVSGTWNERQSLPTEQGVSEGAAAVIENEIYVIADNCPLRDPAVKIYDPISDSWRFGADMPSPHTRRGVAVVAANGKLYAIGGSDGSLSYSLDDVDEYDPSTDTWTARASMPTPRGYASVAVVDGLIYVIGGADFTDASSPACSEVEVYDPVKDSWETVASLPRTSLFAAVAGVIDGEIYVVGGRKGNDYKDTVYRYFPDEDRWNLETPTLLTPRGNAAGGVIGGDFFILGGWESLGDISPLSSIEKGSQVVANCPPNPASCVTPSQLATDVSTDTGLSWQGDDPDCGDDVNYDVYFGNQAESGNDPPLVASGVSEETYNLDKLSYSTKYSWRILSRDNHGMATGSDVFFFETEACSPPSPPTLEDPGEQISTGEYALSWSEVSEASSYIIEEDNCSAFDTPTKAYEGNDTTFTLTGKQDGAYYYRAKAFGCEESNWSNTVDIIVDSEPPTGTVVINQDTEVTNLLYVDLHLEAGDAGGSGVVEMRLSNDGSTWNSWQTFESSFADWDLTAVGGDESEGMKAVYVEYRDAAGNHSAAFTDNIEYSKNQTSAVFEVTLDGNVSTVGRLYGKAFLTGSADIAEWVRVTEEVECGDVLAFDINAPESYCLTSTPCSSLVAGVVSSEPGFTLGQAGTDGCSKALLALVGIVPGKVTNEGGPIQPGDLLVSSSTPGYAMRWEGEGPCPCALVGKAMEPFDGEKGLIQVLLTAH